MNQKIKIIAPSKNTRRLFFYKMSFSYIGNNNKFSEYFLVLIKLLLAYGKMYDHSIHAQNHNKFFFTFLIHIRMSRKSINFDNKNIEKSDFYRNKKLFKIEDIDINKIFVPKKESYGIKNAIKYFIGYIDNNEIKLTCIRLPQMIRYVKYFDDNKAMSFKVTDKKLLNIVKYGKKLKSY